MSNVNISYEGVETCISQLDEQIKILTDLFNEQDRNFNTLRDPSIYYSPANEACIKKYHELSNKYDDILLNLVTYKNFLVGVVSAYRQYDDIINKNANSLSN